MRHSKLAHDERGSDAVVESLPEVVVGEVEKGSERRETHIVDQDVDAAELIDSGLHHAFAVGAFERVGSEREAFTARIFDLLDRLFHLRRRPRRADDGCACFCEHLGDTLTYTTPGAGDYRDLTI